MSSDSPAPARRLDPPTDPGRARASSAPPTGRTIAVKTSQSARTKLEPHRSGSLPGLQLSAPATELISLLNSAENGTFVDFGDSAPRWHRLRDILAARHGSAATRRLTRPDHPLRSLGLVAFHAPFPGARFADSLVELVHAASFPPADTSLAWGDAAAPKPARCTVTAASPAQLMHTLRSHWPNGAVVDLQDPQPLGAWLHLDRPLALWHPDPRVACTVVRQLGDLPAIRAVGSPGPIDPLRLPGLWPRIECGPASPAVRAAAWRGPAERAPELVRSYPYLRPWELSELPPDREQAAVRAREFRRPEPTPGLLPCELDTTQPHYPTAVRRRLSLARRLLLSRGGQGHGALRLLLYGPPGTGKTLAASVLASELGWDLFRVHLPSLLSKWVGETEQHLERVFAAVERTHSVVLFDEGDSLFQHRRAGSGREGSHHSAFLLQRLERFEGVAIVTTNLLKNLDHAFRRRFDLSIHIPLPDSSTRATLCRRAVGNHWELLAAESTFSPASIRHVGELSRAMDRTGISACAVRAAIALEQERLGRQRVGGQIAWPSDLDALAEPNPNKELRERDPLIAGVPE